MLCFKNWNSTAMSILDQSSPLSAQPAWRCVRCGCLRRSMGQEGTGCLERRVEGRCGQWEGDVAKGRERQSPKGQMQSPSQLRQPCGVTAGTTGADPAPAVGLYRVPVGHLHSIECCTPNVWSPCCGPVDCACHANGDTYFPKANGARERPGDWSKCCPLMVSSGLIKHQSHW